MPKKLKKVKRWNAFNGKIDIWDLTLISIILLSIIIYTMAVRMRTSEGMISYYSRPGIIIIENISSTCLLASLIAALGIIFKRSIGK